MSLVDEIKAQIEFEKKKEEMALLIAEAMRNHPPMKEDTLKILNELKKLFPGLEAMKGPMSKLSGTISITWWNYLPIYDLLIRIEREIKKKPFHSKRAREVFAYVLWLAFDLLFKNDLVRKDEEKEQQGEYKQGAREIRAETIQSHIKSANALFKKTTHSKEVLILREDIPGFFTKLPTRCKGVNDFSRKIQSLGSLFEVDRGPLRKIVKNADPNEGSIKLVQRWFEENNILDYSQVIETWKNIRRIRKAPPTHPDLSSDIIEAIMFFDERFPVNFTTLWDSILDKFVYSLEKLLEILQNTP
jgi:hypothetical protein